MSTLFDIEVLEFTARTMVAAVFLMAGTAKLMKPRALARDIGAYHLLPASVSRPLGFLLPPLEILLGSFLLVGVYPAMAATAVVLLMSAFLLATLSAIARGLNIDCGCFGLLYRQRLGRAVLTRDAFLLVAAIYVLQFNVSRLGVVQWSAPTDSGNLLALATVAAVGFVTVNLAFRARDTVNP